MKKILYLITQSEHGGAQAYINDLASNLNSEFEIIVAFGEQGENGWLAKKLKKQNIKYYSLSHLKRSIFFWHDFLALLQIIKLMIKERPDILHLNSSKISILGSSASFLYKLFTFNFSLLTIYTVHGWVFNEPDRNTTLYKLAEKLTAPFKNKLICVSEFDKQLAIKEKIVSEKKLVTIHNGIAAPNFLSKDQALKKINSRCAIKNLGQDSRIIIGSIGNLYKTKGFEYLINATKILADNGLNISTIIIGEGLERAELENWINQLGLKDHFFLPGRFENASSLLLAFDIYACSSVKEGLSYTVMEAMMAGLPIIATSVGGNTELIKNNQEGLLVPPADASALAKALMQIISDDDLSKKFSASAQERALKYFQLSRMINETKNIYLK